MEELIVQSHNFEQAKKELKKFSEKIPKELKLGKIDSEKEISEFVSDFVLGRGIGKDHIVKGKEINELIEQIQTNLKDINEIHIEFITQVGNVYDALKSLDEDYIKKICVVLAAATQASKEAKTAQKDIKTTVENQKKMIQVLQRFKKELEVVKHINDVDKIWDETVSNIEEIDKLWKRNQESDEIIEKLSKNQKELQTEIKKLPEIESIIETEQKKIKELEALKTNLEKIEHIEDIDVIWNETENHKQKIINIEKSIKNLDTSMVEQEDKVKKLQEVGERIEEIRHLADVDALWENVQKSDKEIEKLSKNQKRLLIEIKKLPGIKSIIETEQRKIKKLEILKTNLEKIEHIEDIDVIWDETENHKHEIRNIEKSVENLEKENQGLIRKIETIKNESDKKIKTAYILAGSSMGLAIVELIIMVMRLM